ncbi:lipopolysaccharide heptosyltransferase II [Sporomusa sp.]|uniref:lipopolysaccharide heptosyltransferase II n=1 Tax=Sporomusa sp. TaxID=2078658 RepID=UPI002CED5F54|nr:lipopolysaccharide heptosyltransferase II [Sporomusa sp.]HWR44306.1 lipopolysaccharide heptosyltransferase II [Sporomusa sp.]
MTYKNILIVKLSAIGDVIHALPVAPALKKCFPQARITWVVEQPAYDLLTNNPYIDEIITFEKAKFKSFTGFCQYAPGFISALRQRRFDLALDLQGLFKSAAISFLSGAPQRLVYCNAREYSDVIGKKTCGPNQNGHIVERCLDVVRELGCKIDEPEFMINISAKEAELACAISKQAGLDINRRYVVLIPGTNWPNKCWSTDNFAKLADKVFEHEIIPVFVGGGADRLAVDEIISKSTVVPIDLVGKTSLKQLAYIIRNSCAVVAGDTGPMHLAAALNTPVIALFGPTDPSRNGPYGTQHIVLTANRSCQGCWHRKCPKEIDCLSDINAELVYQELLKIVG